MKQEPCPAVAALIAAQNSIPWAHNAGVTNDIEALRRIVLAYSDWWNETALPIVERHSASSQPA